MMPNVHFPGLDAVARAAEAAATKANRGTYYSRTGQKGKTSTRLEGGIPKGAADPIVLHA